MKWQGAAIGVVGLGAVLIVGANAAFGSPGAYRDGEGPLASADDPQAFQSMAVDPSRSGGPWTFGVRLCVKDSADPAVITSVGPESTIGAGFEVLGTQVRDWSPTQTDSPIISVDRWPVSTHAELHPAVGFTVTQPCSEGVLARYTELLIGLARVGTSGGGWQGILVGSDVSGKHGVLAIKQNIAICGPSVIALCAGPPSPGPT